MLNMNLKDQGVPANTRLGGPILKITGLTKGTSSALVTGRRYFKNESLQRLTELFSLIRKIDVRGSEKGQPIEKPLDELSIEIRSGCVVGVIGSSVQSSRALIAILSRADLPTSGEVRFYGRVGSFAQLGLSAIGHMTCRQNLVHGARLAGATREEIRAAIPEVGEFSGLGDYLDLPLRRVPKWVLIDLGISLLCCMDRDIIVADEIQRPVSQTLTQNWQNYLAMAAERGKIVITTSRRIKNVLELNTHLLLIDRGRLLDFGPADEIKAKHSAFLRRAEDAFNKAPQMSELGLQDEDDDEEDDEQDGLINGDGDAPGRPSYQPSLDGILWIPLQHDPALAQRLSRSHQETRGPLGSVPYESRTSKLCRIATSQEGLKHVRLGGSALGEEATSGPFAAMSAQRDRLIIPVDIAVPNLRLWPALDLTLKKKGLPVVRIFSKREFTVVNSGRVVFEAPIPSWLLPNVEFLTTILISVLESNGTKPDLVVARNPQGIRRMDEQQQPLSPDYSLHKAASWLVEPDSSEEHQQAPLWLVPWEASETGLDVTMGKFPRLKRMDSFRLSAPIRIERAPTQVGGHLDLKSGEGHILRMHLEPPVTIEEAGDYMVSIDVPGHELGPSIFEAELALWLAPPTGQDEPRIHIERKGNFVIEPEERTGALLAWAKDATALVELDLEWVLQARSE
jgi:ABC-type polysaccharide/polyol phosphate transport system ATPase subunit